MDIERKLEALFREGKITAAEKNAGLSFHVRQDQLGKCSECFEGGKHYEERSELFKRNPEWAEILNVWEGQMKDVSAKIRSSGLIRQCLTFCENEKIPPHARVYNVLEDEQICRVLDALKYAAPFQIVDLTLWDNVLDPNRRAEVKGMDYTQRLALAAVDLQKNTDDLEKNLKKRLTNCSPAVKRLFENDNPVAKTQSMLAFSAASLGVDIEQKVNELPKKFQPKPGRETSEFKASIKIAHATARKAAKKFQIVLPVSQKPEEPAKNSKTGWFKDKLGKFWRRKQGRWQRISVRYTKERHYFSPHMFDYYPKVTKEYELSPADFEPDLAT